ncbi:unnamed protein product [Moneuplotes crassus]|uniref:TRAF-type domain-containing protein n=1 Tax=Euplotes crassus TaxID=5936 RepID=A0AAD1XGF9_EUPCR|nr:unnamed protein product [Moneuplotes crassus]
MISKPPRQQTVSLKAVRYSSTPQSESTDDTYSGPENVEDYCKTHGTKYCLDKQDNCLSLFSRIFIENATQNQERVKAIFTSNDKGIMNVIQMLKCNLCHDILQASSIVCDSCKLCYCVECQENYVIETNSNCLNECSGEFSDLHDENQKFLLKCLKFKCENAQKGCESSFKTLKDLKKHEERCDFSFRTCQYCYKKKIMKKNLQNHLVSNCKIARKCQNFPKCAYIGTRDQVETHQEDDCAFTEIYCTTCLKTILRRDKDTHSCIETLRTLLCEKQNFLDKKTSKLSKITEENSKLRIMLENMKKTLLEKCEYEGKLKREIKRVTKESMKLTSPKKSCSKGSDLVTKRQRTVDQASPSRLKRTTRGRNC